MIYLLCTGTTACSVLNRPLTWPSSAEPVVGFRSLFKSGHLRLYDWCMRFFESGGVRLSVIGLGTWQFGSREWGYGRTYASTTAEQLVIRAAELEINLVDTAEMYAGGESERILGKAIIGDRDRYFVATKFAPFLPLPSVLVSRSYRSAARLGISRIDLLQMHWPNPFLPVSVQIRGMATVLERGLAKNIGVSNYSLSQWLSAEKSLGHPIISNQVHYSLLSRRADRELVPYAQAHDRLVIAYSPLEQGALTGKYGLDNRPGGVRRLNKHLKSGGIAKAMPLMSALAEVAKANSASISQIALAWLVSQPNVVAIPGASSVAQLESNAAAADLELSRAAWDHLSSFK